MDILNLTLPYFGIIFIGFACGKLKRLPEPGLAWMTFFILYVSLPAVFFRIMAKTPFEKLAQWHFIAATSLATFAAIVLSIAVGLIMLRGHLASATLAGVAGGFGNVGYMGTGLAIAALGAEATAPVALIFCFDALITFAVVPVLMSASGSQSMGFARTLRKAVAGIALNPLLLAAALGAAAAALRLELPLALDRMLQFLYVSAAPCALFAIGVTVALRPIQRVAPVVPALVAIKLVVHPALAIATLAWLGPFDIAWVQAGVLMAALPPALTVFVYAREYDIWLEEASSVVLIGTALSVATLTALLWALRTGALPLLAR